MEQYKEKIFNEFNRIRFTLMMIILLLGVLFLMSAKDTFGLLTPPDTYCSFDTANITGGYNVSCTGGVYLRGGNTPTMNKISMVGQGAGTNASQLEYFVIEPDNFNFNSSSWSISMIYNLSSASGSPVLMARTDGATAAGSALLFQLDSTSGKMDFSFWYKSASSGSIRSQNVFNTTNVLTYLAVTYDKNTGNFSIYKNGTFDSNMTFIGMNNLSAHPFYFTRYGTSPSAYMSTNYIDEFKFWNNTVLTPTDIQADYNRVLSHLRPDEDTISPGITMIYPPNNTRMNDYNGTISMSINESGYCSVNNTGWTHTYDNYSFFQFDRISTPDGKYNITVNCSDASYNKVSALIYFEVDTGKPSITKYLPANNSISNQTQHNIVIDAHDSFSLWQINRTVRNSTGALMYNALTTNISIASDVPDYNISDIVNSTSWTATQDNFSLFIEVWDAHTDDEIDAIIFPKDEYTMDEDKELIVIDDKPIQIIHPDSEIFDFDVLTDRVNFEITESESTMTGEPKETYFIVYGENIVSLPNSRYSNHHIINNEIWMDTEGIDNAEIERLSSDSIKVSYSSDFENPIEVQSFGTLNYMSQQSYFYIDKVPPMITVIYPNESVYNYSMFANYLEIAVSENSSCTQNATEFFLLSSNATSWKWVSTFVNTGNHTVLFSCTDNYGNLATSEISFETLSQTTGTGANVTVNTSTTVNIDIPLIIVILIYLFLIMFAFKSAESYILIFASIYGLFMGLWLWNSYPVFPKPIVLIIFVFNAFLMFMVIGKKNK